MARQEVSRAPHEHRGVDPLVERQLAALAAVVDLRGLVGPLRARLLREPG